METTNQSVMEISLKEILAVIVRGTRRIIVFAIVFAVLFGAFGALDYYVLAEDPDKEYRVALEEYELTKYNLENTIERTKIDVANQKDYNEKSQLMHIDPHNKITTTMIFAISGVNLEEITDPFQITQTPITYITSRIQAQYMVLWSGLDLEKIVVGTQYEAVTDKYLREVISLTSAEGGVLQLTVHGNNAADCEQIAENLYAALAQSKEAVVKASYDHIFTKLSETITKSSIDLALEQTQLDNKDKLEHYQMSIVECEKELLELKKPSYDGGMKGIVVNAILGAVVGMLVAMLCLVGVHFVKGRVSGAKQLAKRYSLIHFGSLTKKSGLWKLLASRIMGEKLWHDRAQARAYICANGANHLPENGQFAVVSTLDDLEENVKNEMVEVLSAQGRTVVFVTDIAHNPEALAAMTQSSGIVLAERAFASQNAAVKELLETAKELNKPVYGFVML